MSILHTILVRPFETEKAYAGQQKGKYIFEVSPSANKLQVAQAVKKYYGVEVESVRIIKTPAKYRQGGRGREITKRASIKKAIITTVGSKPIDVNKIKV